MQGAGLNIDRIGARVAFGLVALALLLRVMIPAGFMPAAGQGLAIELCTGMGATPAWVDADGKVHKGRPDKGSAADHPCAFAGFGALIDLPAPVATPAPPFRLVVAALVARVAAASVGQGLAAPPPPQTGPPASL